jgi:hypothetical protein
VSERTKRWVVIVKPDNAYFGPFFSEDHARREAARFNDSDVSGKLAIVREMRGLDDLRKYASE